MDATDKESMELLVASAAALIKTDRFDKLIDKLKSMKK